MSTDGIILSANRASWLATHWRLRTDWEAGGAILAMAKCRWMSLFLCCCCLWTRDAFCTHDDGGWCTRRCLVAAWACAAHAACSRIPVHWRPASFRSLEQPSTAVDDTAFGRPGCTKLGEVRRDDPEHAVVADLGQPITSLSASRCNSQCLHIVIMPAACLETRYCTCDATGCDRRAWPQAA